MPGPLLRNLFCFLRRECAPLEGPDLSDGALVKRFLDGRDEAAFEALLERHGSMVLGVCRRVLGDAHAAEDAFQATFLVLARRAVAIRNHASVGSWLFGVAQRIAGKARAQAAARRDRETQAATMPRSEPHDERTWQELRAVLDEEIGRLPQKYRSAVVLCHLEGKSYERAAQELGCPKSTLASRLAKALELLRGQLTRRGLALPAGALATALAEKAVGAPVPALLALNIMKAAANVAAGKTLAAGVLSTQAIALAEEAMKTMIGIKGKLVVLLLTLGLAVGAAVAGYGAWVGQAPPKQDDKQPPAAQGEPAKKDAPGAPAKDLHGDPLPAGAVARLGQDRWLHGGSAYFATFSPDGKTVRTLCTDNTVRVWEFPSGKELRRITLRVEPGPWGAAASAVTRDGQTLVTTTMREVGGMGGGILPGRTYFCDMATGKPLGKTWPGQTRTTKALAFDFSPNGEHLASMHGGGTVRIWDWANAKEIRSFAVGGQDVTHMGGLHLAYAPDGKSIATCRSVDKPKKFAGGRARPGVVKLWDPATGAEIRTLFTENEYKDKEVPPNLSLGFAPDGKTIAIRIGATITLVECATGKEIAKLATEDKGYMPYHVSRFVFSKDSTKLYSGWNSFDEAMDPFRVGFKVGLKEWDIATGKLLRKYLAPGVTVESMWLSPDGNTLIVGGPGPQFFDLSSGKDITALNHPTRPMSSLQFLPDGKSLLTYRGNVLEKWDVASGKNLGPFGGGSGSISPDGKVVAQSVRKERSGFPTLSKIILIDAASAKEIGQVTLQDPAGYGNESIFFSPDGKTLAIFRPRPNKGKIELYDVSTAKLVRTLDVIVDWDDSVGLPMVFSPDGQTLAWHLVTEKAAGVTLFNTVTGKQVGLVPMPQIKIGGLGLFGSYKFAFAADGRCLAVDMLDGTAALYEVATAQLRGTFGIPPLEEPKWQKDTCFTFSPDGKTFAQSGPDNIVHLWDIVTGKELAAFKGHAEGVNAVAFAPDGKKFASVSDDSTALIWDVTKLKRPVMPAKALQPGDLDKHWQALAETNAAKAWAAMGDLVAAPKEAVAWIKDRVKPAAPLETKRVQELVAQLDDEQFKVRDKAAAELLQLGERLVPVLDKALAAKPPLETRQRLEKLRTTVTALRLEGERLRAYRAVEVLELIGTPQARQVLQALAAGAPAALVTVSAQAALKR